jgi:DMSO/TMAO reductase YedYZ molybdopterin-dependent catalytic subunit
MRDGTSTLAERPAPEAEPPRARLGLLHSARALLARAPVDRAVTAMALALLAVWAAARVSPLRFPPDVVAEWMMARTPADLANVLLERLGMVARPAAVLGGFACYLALAHALGLAERLLNVRRSPYPRWLSWLLLPALGMVWGLLARILDQPPLPNALLLALFSAGWLVLRPDSASVPMPISDGPSRRRVLRAATLSGGAVLLSANVIFLHALARGLRGVRLGGEPLFRFTPPAPRVEGFALAGLSTEVTPVPGFYTMSKNVADPVIAAGDWSLRVGGLVRDELRLAYDELLTLPRHDQYVTLRCVSNRVDGRLMSTALFSGVRVRDLLERAGLDPAAGTVVFRSPDGHADSLDLGRALADETLIAYAMNGRTLSREHGFPARLLAPGLYGFKHVKWLTEIEVISGPFTGHWQALGWTATARVKTMARVDRARREGAAVLAAGVAYAGDRGIRRVQVRGDDGPWQDAVLHAPPLSSLAWTQWRAELPPDTRTVTVRAVDGTGDPQPEAARGQFPDGAQGLHRVTVREA